MMKTRTLWVLVAALASARADGQTLVNAWGGGAPASVNGQGGTTQEDRAVDTRGVVLRDSCGSESVRAVFVATKTWVAGDGGGGWALKMLRYDYVDGSNLASSSHYVYPAAPTPNNYFVPTAMEFVGGVCDNGDGTTASTRIVVAGYSPASQYGNTDYHIITFDGNLTPIWMKTYSYPVAIQDVGYADEVPVDIDIALGMNWLAKVPFATNVIGVTGNTHNGTNWDSQTVFFCLNTGDNLGVIHESSAAGNDRVCGIRMFPSAIGPYSNTVSYVVGTQGEAHGNSIVAYRYSADQVYAGGWVTDTRSLCTGAHLTANAMSGNYVEGTAGDFAYVAGKAAGYDQTHMLLAKLDFFGSGSYDTTFSFNGGSTAPRTGEALAMDYLPTPADTSVADFIAISGYSYRDSSHGNDPVVCLFTESSGSPVMLWSAWLNLSDTAYDVHDVCPVVKVDASTYIDPGSGNPARYLVHCAGQVPTSSTNMDWRTAVFSSGTAGVDPDDPGTKAVWGNTLEFSGSASGIDIPRSMQLNPFGFLDWVPPPNPVVATHNFIVVGDVWNGSTAGFDVLTRRVKFIEPIP